jgi:NADH-quinone oxidoreductase subunit N
MALILVATLACVTLAHAYLGEGGSGYRATAKSCTC